MKKNKKKYNLKIDQDQLEVIMEALEMWSRLYIGQLETSKMPPLNDFIWKKKISFDERCKIDENLNSVKKIIWNLPPNASSRILDEDGKGDFAYSLYKQMRNHIEIDKMKKEGKNYKYNVYSTLPSSVNPENKIFIETVDKRLERKEKLNKLK